MEAQINEKEKLDKFFEFWQTKFAPYIASFEYKWHEYEYWEANMLLKGDYHPSQFINGLLPKIYEYVDFEDRVTIWIKNDKGETSSFDINWDYD